MREILFRGKDFSGVINHSWCFGSLDTTEDDRAIIIYLDRFGNKCQISVNPETVGQYIGLTDKNGTKIFEGDIVKRFLLGKMCIYQIIYDNGLASFIGQAGIKFTTFDYDSAEFEVVGNIYDNPELLECNAMECAIEALKEHIDAEKIPHCQDCKNFVNCKTYSYCEEYGGFVKENDYCSRIEIKAKRGEDIDNAER